MRILLAVRESIVWILKLLPKSEASLFLKPNTAALGSTPVVDGTVVNSLCGPVKTQELHRALLSEL